MEASRGRDAIVLWTIQPRVVWTQLRERGVVRAAGKYIPSGGVPPPYRWLIGQLETRFGWPKGRLPWWSAVTAAATAASGWWRTRGRTSH